MAEEVIRLGIVGAGNFVRGTHLPNFRKLPGVELVAVCNRSVGSGQRVAREFGIARVLTDWRELVALPEVDAVLIGTWPYLHAPVTLAALDAGKHVLCLGRMAMDLAEARAMYRKSQERPRQVALLVPPAFSIRGDALMRKLLADNYLGRIHQILDYRLTAQYADPDQPISWRQSKEYSGINMLLLGASFEVLHRWFGEHRQVFAQSRIFHRKKSEEDALGQTPDAITVLAELESGATVTYLQSGVARFASPARLEIYGLEGTLVSYQSPEAIHGARAGEPELRPIPIPPDLETRWSVEEDFIAMIREGKAPAPTVPSFLDGVKYMEFTEACLLSAEGGRWVELPLP